MEKMKGWSFLPTVMTTRSIPRREGAQEKVVLLIEISLNMDFRIDCLG